MARRNRPVGDRAPAAVTPTAGYNAQSDQLYFESTTGWVQGLSAIDGVHAGVYAGTSDGSQPSQQSLGIQSVSQTTYVFSWDFREAGYNNEVGVYYVDNEATGAINTGTDENPVWVSPGDSGYRAAASHIVAFVETDILFGRTDEHVAVVARHEIARAFASRPGPRRFAPQSPRSINYTRCP